MHGPRHALVYRDEAHDFIYERGLDGVTRLAVPKPYYLVFGWVRCGCGRRFRTEDRYHAHWTRQHGKGLS